MSTNNSSSDIFIPEVYGNAPEGDFPAKFIGAWTARYPKSNRIIFGFLCLNEAITDTIKDEEGADAFAVAVCNSSEGRSPKSKSFKICKAMLEADEFDPIESARPPRNSRSGLPFQKEGDLRSWLLLASSSKLQKSNVPQNTSKILGGQIQGQRS